MQFVQLNGVSSYWYWAARSVAARSARAAAADAGDWVPQSGIA
jgi:hypothetical protein